jgi:CRISPR-associated endonuclease Csy4
MHYQELFIFPDPETPRHVLRAKVFQALHLSFVGAEKVILGKQEIETVRFGISFPNYHAALFELDYTIRVFAPSEHDFEKLELPDKLKTLRDYLRLGSVLPVPETVTFSCFKRKQVKSGLERRARRLVARGNAPSFEDALEKLKKAGAKKRTQLPYIYTDTSSTGKHRVPIFIDKTDVDSENEGSFTTYGLSKNGSTVPVF